MNIKRSRSSNFSKEEELLLLEEVNKLKNIIECKTINKLTLYEKEMAWQKVLHAFNAKNFQARTLEQLKAKYDNLKTKARKEVAMLKFNQAGIVGEPSSSTSLDSSTKAILNITNLKSVLELENKLNNDATNDIIINGESFMTAPFLVEVEYNKKCKTSVKGIPQDSLIAVKENNENIVAENFAKNENFPSNINSIAPTALSNVAVGPDESNYTHLKEKESVKLQPQFPNPVIEAKEKYYKRKLEIMEKCFENDSIDRENRIKKEEEEHKKKMILLDFEIEIKRKQLTKM